MNTTPPLMTGKELADVLGIPESTFHRHRRRGAFRHLEAPRPVGIRKYARALVEKVMAGQSTVQLVRRKAS